jgi:hypothetical protein
MTKKKNHDKKINSHLNKKKKYGHNFRTSVKHPFMVLYINKSNHTFKLPVENQQ